MDAEPLPKASLDPPQSTHSASSFEAEPKHLEPYIVSLISSALDHNMLLFGSFALKSGRTSPYFYNAGLYRSGLLLTSIGSSYAAAIAAGVNAGLKFDVVFGPAYKGIPLAAVAVVELARLNPQQFGRVEYAYNRKEKKDHGEGGSIVGAPLKGKRVLVLDDVITAGTAMREAIGIISAEGGEVVGAVVNLDRQERGQNGELSAIQEVEKEFGFQVITVLTVSDIIAYMRAKGGMGKELAAMEAYQAEWGVKET